MKKIILALAAALTLGPALADEGMWLPALIGKNWEQMQKLGLTLSADQLYDINHSSLKDAVVWFNGGCTAEIISDEGLLLTNHHCGYEAIANHSTTADDILDNGFWAKSYAEEKSNPGMWISILVRMDDVSDRVNKALEGLDAKAAEAKRMEVFKQIEKEATAGTGYEAMVKSMFKDNAYYVFVFEKFTDIRLVAAPPQSLGKFGGDTDNWMWPRHTADFSMFRIYANKDNKPAPYSADNVPYKPKRSLAINIKGLNEGDFTMIYGVPGRTNRYETSYGIQLATDKVNPAIVALRDVRLREWKTEMDKSDSVRLLLSSQYAKIANYWKYYIGQTEQLKHLKVLEEKQAAEKKFAEWAKNKPEYASILSNFESAYNDYNNYALHATYMREGVTGSSLIAYAASFTALEKALNGNNNAEEVKKAIENVKKSEDNFYKSFNVRSEEVILGKLTQMFYMNISASQHPAYLTAQVKKNKGKTEDETFQNISKNIFAKSFMVTKAGMDKFLENPGLKKLLTDPAYAYFKAFYDNYNTNIKPHIDAFNTVNNAEGKKYMKALMEMQPDKNFYPDANSTFRITYGTVKSYDPKDGVHYNYYTTLSGVMEKENPNSFEFKVPAKLKELYATKNFGQYANANGDITTAFISNNDITGGNSGSPVMNGNGQLVGIAFDGNWEAMSGDIYFDQKYKRTISCDIRYILFLIDKFGGAQNLISEMKIVK